MTLLPPRLATLRGVMRVNAALSRQRGMAGGWQRADGPHVRPEGAAFFLHRDPEARGALEWASPRGRLVELKVAEDAPCRFLALHVPLPLRDLRQTEWLGLALRGAGDPVLSLRACLRSGLPGGGFHDSFFPRNLPQPPHETDMTLALCPARDFDLPLRAGWRDLILFLPPGQRLAWSLHDLRIFAL